VLHLSRLKFDVFARHNNVPDPLSSGLTTVLFAALFGALGFRPDFSNAFRCLAMVRSDAAHRRHAVDRTTPARMQTCHQRTPSARSQTIRASSGSSQASQPMQSSIRWISRALGTTRIRTRRSPEIVLKSQNVAGRFAPVRAFGMAPVPADQPGGFQLFEVDIQRRAGDFGIGRQLVLRRETPEIRVVPVAEIQEHQLGHGAKSALPDRPVGGLVAHSAAMTVRRFTIACIRAMRLLASSWRFCLPERGTSRIAAADPARAGPLRSAR